jgi:hypothetical protein
MITVVTEGIFSYCGVKVKIDTDRHLGPERALVRVDGEPIGHVTTGGVRLADAVAGRRASPHRRRQEGRPRDLRIPAGPVQRQAGEVTIDDGSTVVIEAGKPPVVNGVKEERMRVGCGSATVGMFASQWHGLVDEVVVVDDHITGVMSEHQAGKVIGWARPASRSRAGARRRGAISRWPSPAPAGAAPTSTIRWSSWATSMPRWPGRASRC